MWVCAYIYIGWVYCCVCNICDRNIPYKSSGLTLHVCACMYMDVVRCMHAYILPEVHVYKAEQSCLWRGPLLLGALYREVLLCACWCIMTPLFPCS